jgi:acetyl esterase/lipase
MTPVRLALAAMLTTFGMFIGFTPAQERKPEPAPAAPPPVEQFEKHSDIAYVTGADADPEKHTLDVYTPKGRKDFPVLFFVHGGTWRSGSKNLYVAIGQAFAQAGIGTVVINYRLSPKVKHPAHIQDVARAFAWTHANIAKYGGNPARIFVFGHSAGGHLVSLLATDPEYLKAQKLAPTDIRGVISVSGVYTIPPDFGPFRPIFGSDEAACRKASPLSHVSGGHPPFLIAYADKDFAQLDTMAIDMNAVLEKCKSPTKLLKLQNRNHYTIIIYAITTTDPLNIAIRAFVATAGVK